MIILLQAADGESQPSTDVDLFVSTEKVMVLNTDLQVSLLLSYLSADAISCENCKVNK